MPFRLINPTSKPINLYKGASLGTFSEADGDPNIDPVGDGSPVQPPPQKTDQVPLDLRNSALNLEQ